MTNEEKTKLKNKIQLEISSIEKHIKQLKETVKPVSPDNAIGRLTRMEAINAKSISEEGLRSAEVKLAKLKRGLLRADEDNFGLCIRCEEPIPFARLMLLPESTMCVGCAETK